jgi:hypothetical protein
METCDGCAQVSRRTDDIGTFMTELSKVITNWLDAGTSRTRPESVPCLSDRPATTPCVERSDEDPHGFLQE